MKIIYSKTSEKYRPIKVVRYDDDFSTLEYTKELKLAPDLESLLDEFLQSVQAATDYIVRITNEEILRPVSAEESFSSGD